MMCESMARLPVCVCLRGGEVRSEQWTGRGPTCGGTMEVTFLKICAALVHSQ